MEVIHAIFFYFNFWDINRFSDAWESFFFYYLVFVSLFSSKYGQFKELLSKISSYYYFFGFNVSDNTLVVISHFNQKYTSSFAKLSIIFRILRICRNDHFTYSSLSNNLAFS